MTTECLSRDAIRRILLSLITIQQDELIKKGTLDKEKALAMQALRRTDALIDALEIDEDSLGFDSLSRLDLVLRVNQFFQLHATGVEDYLLVKRKIGDWIDLILQHFEISAGKGQFAFQTSGSTGASKTIIHNFRTLLTEVETLQSDVIGTRPRSARIISLVPPHHMYGFMFSCLLPSMTSTETLSLYQQTPTRCFALAKSGDIVIATPFIWEKLTQSGLQFRPGVLGITSGGPSCPAPFLWATFEQGFWNRRAHV